MKILKAKYLHLSFFLSSVIYSLQTNFKLLILILRIHSEKGEFKNHNRSKTQFQQALLNDVRKTTSINSPNFIAEINLK